MKTRFQDVGTAQAHWEGVKHALCDHAFPAEYSAEEKAAYERGRYDEIDAMAAADPSRPVPMNGQRCPSDQSERY
ncbi:MAG: hypothetical protein AAB539_04380 [Patescibacteria group bacterium]